MVSKVFVLATCVSGFIVASSLPASAQFGDFFCDKLTIGCPEPPPPPPPPPVEAAPPPVKKVVKKKPKPKPVPKVEKATPAEAAPAPTTK